MGSTQIRRVRTTVANEFPFKWCDYRGALGRERTRGPRPRNRHYLNAGNRSLDEHHLCDGEDEGDGRDWLFDDESMFRPPVARARFDYRG